MQLATNGKRSEERRTRHSSLFLTVSAATLSMAAALVIGASGAGAAGGTAKPPGGGGGGGGGAPPPACPSGGLGACIVPAAGPVLPNFPAAGGALSGNLGNGFSITGYVQAVTGPACPVAPATAGPGGGTVVVNGLTIVIPSNTIVQYPANTLTWGDALCGIAPIALDGTGGTGPVIYPGVEISVDGNITDSAGGLGTIGTPHVASIVHLSQQTLNSGSGYISTINYVNGAMTVTTAAGTTATLILNDPKGRFGRPQSSPDARFSVDDANPTIKSGATGYPMCVPRLGPPAAGGNETDLQCPQKNRPTAACRNFASAGLAFRIVADLGTTPINGFCTGFVMKALANMPGTVGLPAGSLANGTGIVLPGSNTDPDPREMAPFEVGDFITWQGTLVHTPGAAVSTDVTWVHTIDANVGIYTQPGTLPAYVAIGQNGIGTAPEPKTAAALAGVEAAARVFAEAKTTDVASVLDFYLDDKGFSLPAASAPAGPIVPNAPGSAATEYFRWFTPETMTGTVAEQALQTAKGTIIPTTSLLHASAFGGGIYTQFIGPQPGRARIRASKVPAIDPTLACPTLGATIGGVRGCAVTQSPTRYIRAALRSLCAPASSGTLSEIAGRPAVPSNNLSAAGGANTGAYFNINGPRANLPGAGVGAYQGTAPGLVGPPDGSCLQSAQYANGLFTGQYMAPVGGYIFPENTFSGFPAIPFDFWHMGFLAYGENGRDGNSTAQQVPRPW